MNDVISLFSFSPLDFCHFLLSYYFLLLDFRPEYFIELRFVATFELDDIEYVIVFWVVFFDALDDRIKYIEVFLLVGKEFFLATNTSEVELQLI